MKIALFLPNWIGDTVMATPALRALRNHFQNARIFAVLRHYVAGVLEGCPWFDEQIIYDNKGSLRRKFMSPVFALRRHAPDLAVLFPNSLRTALLAWFGKCRRRIGYHRFGRSLLLTDRLEPVRDEQGRIKPSPIIKAYNLLAQTAGCPDPGFRMELFTSAADEDAAAAVWQEEGLDAYPEVICLNPGAAFGSAKYWPTEYFAALAQRLTDERGCGVLVLCGPAERDLGRHIVNLAARPAVRSIAGYPLSLGLTKACVRRADLLVTTDSGPRHFAAAFDRPVVSLFGPTHIAWTETYHTWEICLQKSVPCGPCQQRVCPLDHRCMNELVPVEVFGAVTSLLTRRASGGEAATPASGASALAGRPSDVATGTPSPARPANQSPTRKAS
jgi:heptosyltransferase-2